MRSSHPILVCSEASEAECYENRTHLVWPPKRTGWWQENKESQSWPTTQYSTIRCDSWPRCSPGLQTLHDSTCLLDPRPEHVFSTYAEFDKWDFVLTKHAVVYLSKLSSSPDSTTATLSSPSAFIHTTTLILGTTHRCSSNKRSQSQRPHHTSTETTVLASHPCPYHIQNLPPHVSHPFWNLSIIRVIHNRALTKTSLARLMLHS